ncbi:porin [Comamonas aquatica]|uniref:porin n=1 Tax=Comamonas aquatica TaxID=225991 RepID=UPI0031DF1AA7
MKKSLIALAAVAASGAAFAQSSVTVFGVVDSAVSYVNGQDNWSGLNSGGNQTSRLGFRGVEDLGGGLKANFWLEAGILADNGSGKSGYSANEVANDGLAFKRRATVGLSGNFGEVRMGRELTAAYNATSRYDVFGQVGFGASKVWADAGVNGDSTTQRVSNMVTYLSPDFSGFRANVNYGFGEDKDAQTAKSSNSASSYMGAGLTYDNGPLSLGLGLERRNAGANTAEFIDHDSNPLTPKVFNGEYDVTAWSLGGSYNFGVAKLAAAYRNSEAKWTDGVDSAKDKTKGYYIGLSAPVGAVGEVKASYNRYEITEAGEAKQKADQFALGYVHNMSKRTAVYGTYAYIKNKDGANVRLSSDVALKDGEKQHAVQVGIRHAF